MTNLNSRAELLKIDKSNALGSIEQLPDQIQQAWAEVNAISLPESYSNVENIIVCGMGASWLGAHILQGLMVDRLTKPLIVVHDYELPRFVTNNSLVIASSYSGTTEETITSLEEAKARGAKIFTLSTGGTLKSFAEEHGYPNYTFKPVHNPSKSPRLGVGYSITAQIALLSNLGIVQLQASEIEESLVHIRQKVTELKPETEYNEAKRMAHSLMGNIPIIIGGTFLLGVAHTFANQVNETSKTFGTYMHIPELNHHNLEGLAHPDEVKKLIYVFLHSDLYNKRVLKRFEVTQTVVSENHVQTITYKPNGVTKMVQAFDTLLFSSFVTYYLAMLYEVDPTPNPWVDYFKQQLSK